ncbi:MAG: hypothetical protein QXJ51_01040 [Sulfolobales archaeon]
MFERYLKHIFGVEDIRIRGSYLAGCDDKGCIARGFLIVKDVTRSLDELQEHELSRFLNAYVKILSKPFPIDIRISFIPLDRKKIIDRIDSVIQVKEIIRESDPTNSKILTEIERLRKLKQKLLEGDLPYNIVMIISVSAEGSDENEARERLEQRIKLLSEELKDLGVIVEEVRGLHIIEILNRFFRI